MCACVQEVERGACHSGQLCRSGVYVRGARTLYAQAWMVVHMYVFLAMWSECVQPWQGSKTKSEARHAEMLD